MVGDDVVVSFDLLPYGLLMFAQKTELRKDIRVFRGKLPTAVSRLDR